ncbi:MAG: DEAD/DEAH box helicase family protein [Sedimentisphaerales bacterium]|nr:DEAD/DEAH box helicase family protein [Sedimentisphaerales bacterium]
MDVFPDHIAFQKTWRTYQARVLSELNEHLDDNHLHIIAAPGSGKTVLGLEVVRHLNRPTLIFAPTLAIRDQWVDRLISLFCNGDDAQLEWISKDIRNPKFLTVSTYQGLHRAFTGKVEKELEEEEDESDDGQDSESHRAAERKTNRSQLLKELKTIKIRTLVLDEAHHLRKEWWQCLIEIKKHLDDPTIVALTATPPLDVSPYEWERYIDLCGPVDSEICVPELVLERNLCPHQDYVYLSTPLKAEEQQIEEFRNDVEQFVDELCSDRNFTFALEKHPCIKRPNAFIEEILSDPGFYSSMAFFLNHVKGRPPRKVLRIIGFPSKKCPKLNYEWLEVLLTGCLYSHREGFEGCAELFEGIFRRLHRIGAVERRKVNLRSSDKITKLLVSSISKLKSVEEIVQLESESLGTDLRMVILTDYIRKAAFPKNERDTESLKRIGVVPIFETIRRRSIEGIKLGILSGTLVVIPSDAKRLLEELAVGMGIQLTAVKYASLAHDENYCSLNMTGSDKQNMVKLVTRLFSRGGINVLVGTKSLLGEGWDAPSINSLILASFVGSYMLSNQMRGRAIRTQEDNPDKTANIWHLVCVEQGQKELSEDMEMLARRFKSFVGVSFKENVIENGLGRLGLDKPPYSAKKIDSICSTMTEKARDRERLRAEWEQALRAGEVGQLAEEITSSYFTLPRDFVFTNTILAVLWQAWFWGLFTFSQLMRASSRSSEQTTLRGFFMLLGVACVISALVALPKCLKALYLFLKHAPVRSSMKQIGKILVKSLAHADLIQTPVSKLKVVTASHQYGFVSCSLKGGTTYEKSLFLDSMQELLGPIGNPRYIMVRKTPLLRWIRKDYHVVPQVLAKNKELAEYFAKMWSRYVGPAELVYTRHVEGRKILLKARGHAMSTSFQRRAERIRTWK